MARSSLAVNPERPNEVAVVCVIDNLRKEQAGQALQNLNLALGCDEALALTPFGKKAPHEHHLLAQRRHDHRRGRHGLHEQGRCVLGPAPLPLRHSGHRSACVDWAGLI